LSHNPKAGVVWDPAFVRELAVVLRPGPIEAGERITIHGGLVGATDPGQAEEGTIRKRFAESKAKNAVHGSDSDDNALIEGHFFFSSREQY
jgi:nucleoside-diphosphate kinase